MARRRPAAPLALAPERPPGAAQAAAQAAQAAGAPAAIGNYLVGRAALLANQPEAAIAALTAAVDAEPEWHAGGERDEALLGFGARLGVLAEGEQQPDELLGEAAILGPIGAERVEPLAGADGVTTGDVDGDGR